MHTNNSGRHDDGHAFHKGIPQPSPARTFGFTLVLTRGFMYRLLNVQTRYFQILRHSTCSSGTRKE